MPRKKNKTKSKSKKKKQQNNKTPLRVQTRDKADVKRLGQMSSILLSLAAKAGDEKQFVHDLFNILFETPEAHYQDFVHAGALEALLIVMIRFHDNANLMNLSLAFLIQFLCDEKQENEYAKRVMFLTGGIGDICRVMKTHRQRLDIQRHGGHLLLHLAVEDELLFPLVRLGGLAAIIGAMAQLVDSNSEFTTSAWDVLYYRFLPEQHECSDRVKQMILDAGVVAVFVDTLRHYGNDASEEGPVMFACRSISALARDRDSVKFEFVALGGIQAITKVMDCHEKNARVAAAALRAVEFLCNASTETETHKKAFVDEHIVEKIVTLMDEYASDCAVVRAAVHVLAHLAWECPFAAKAIAHDGGFATTVNAMSRHAVDHDACLAVVSIVNELDSSDVERLLEQTPHALRTIVTSMKKNPANENLQLVACGALEGLVSKTSSGRDLIHVGGLFVLYASVKKFPLHLGIQDAACGTIASLPKEGRLELCPRQVAGVSSTLLESLHHHGSWNDGSFQIKLIKTLCFVAQSSDTAKKEIVAAKGVPLLVAIGNDGDNSGGTEARHLVALLTESGSIKTSGTR